MPELPEVQTVVNDIVPVAVGAKIVQVELLRPEFVQPAAIPLEKLLTGQTIASIHRRANRIIFTLGDGQKFLAHLGMTGRIAIAASSAPRQKHTHVVLTLQRKGKLAELHFCDPRRFGEIRWLGTHHGEDGLGVEPLTLTTRQLVELLRRPRRPIKSVLLDQSVVAGLGNIYADESLFRAGIHPLTWACHLDEAAVGRLCRAIKQILSKALQHRGSTFRDYVDAKGGKGGFQDRHQVYGRSGQPCRQCGRSLQRIVLGGRSTCFCLHCQPPRRMPKSARKQ